MARKKPYKIDPPTKTVTIPGVSSVVADQFNRLISDRKKGTNLTRAQIFEAIVLNERERDVGKEMVACTSELYNEKQEKMRRLNERMKEGPDLETLE